MDCVFCKIIDGSIPSYKIYEDDLVLVFLDIHPDSAGHSLIIPKNHTLDMFSIDDELLIHILSISRNVASLLIKKFNATGVKFVQNNGDLQEVKHFHIHIIPHYKEYLDMEVNEVFDIIKNPNC